MNTLWNFFASVRLAIVILCIIAFTSIFGTLIPQGNSFEWYVNFYSNITIAGSPLGPDTGHRFAVFTNLLDIDSMYSSWWYYLFLTILIINLIVCSIDRIPTVLKQIRMDNLSFTQARLDKIKLNHTITLNNHSTDQTLSSLKSAISDLGWKPQQSPSNSSLLFTEKSPWSRMGVYVVHLSILVIFAGALVGNLFGFKASVMLPETRQTNTVYSTQDTSTIDLGFTVRCDSFMLEYYDNGMPKEYMSELTVIEEGQVVKQTHIEVNKPLKHNGITFYQASYEPYQDFVVTIEDTQSNISAKHLTPFQQQIKWSEGDLSFGVINAETFQNRLARLKIWVSNTVDPPVTFWVNPAEKTPFDLSGKQYTIYVKQMFATGLQVAKDPGVWIVYLGCALMLAGLYVSFFMSHRKVWFMINKTEKNTTISIYGMTNKNKMGFSTVFQSLVDNIEQQLNA